MWPEEELRATWQAETKKLEEVEEFEDLTAVNLTAANLETFE
jgi:hypothetical protein